MIGWKPEDLPAGLKLMDIRQNHAGTRPGDKMFQLCSDEIEEPDQPTKRRRSDQRFTPTEPEPIASEDDARNPQNARCRKGERQPIENGRLSGKAIDGTKEGFVPIHAGILA